MGGGLVKCRVWVIRFGKGPEMMPGLQIGDHTWRTKRLEHIRHTRYQNLGTKKRSEVIVITHQSEPSVLLTLLSPLRLSCIYRRWNEQATAQLICSILLLQRLMETIVWSIWSWHWVSVMRMTEMNGITLFQSGLLALCKLSWSQGLGVREISITPKSTNLLEIIY